MKRLARIICWFTGHWWTHEADMELRDGQDAMDLETALGPGGRLVRTSTCRSCGEVRRTEFL